jgi:hypothetical protein
MGFLGENRPAAILFAGALLNAPTVALRILFDSAALIHGEKNFAKSYALVI